jgi:uncharacterized protein involved in exopolysaccharide biosynthesis
MEKVDSVMEAYPEDTGHFDLNLLDVLITLSRWRKFIFYFTASAVILSVIAVLLIPNKYTASTVVLPPGQSSSGAALLSQFGGSGGMAAAAGASLGIKSPGDMYVSLLHSRTVEDRVIQRFGLMEKYHSKKASSARAALEASVKIVYGAKDGLIVITVTDRDQKQAAEIANGYVEEFRSFSANLAITEASQRRMFFQQQLFEAKNNLSSAEDALRQTQQATGILQIDSQTRALIESASSLRAQIVAKEVQLQGMRTYATEDNPEFIEIKKQLDELQSQLVRLGGMDQVSGMIVPKGRVPDVGMEYLRRVRDVKYYEAISDLIAKQFEMAKLDEARQGQALQVVDLAVPPDTKSSPKRAITIIIVFLLSMFVACGWAIISEELKRLKSNPQENQRLQALKNTFQ